MDHWSVAKKGPHGDKLNRVVDVQQDQHDRPSLKEHIDFLRQRWSEYMVLHVGHEYVLARFERSMMNTRLHVSIVDDDESVRESLPDLLKELGFASRAFSSAEEFLASDGIAQTRCLILDIAMPGMCGPELQQELKERKLVIPIIFITAQRDETLRSRMLDHGAVACLFKPFSDTALLEALNSAFPAQ
jgi:CheY-like chemotaxis protein